MSEENDGVKLSRAVQHYNDGKHKLAESTAKIILASSPGHPNALSLLAAIAVQQNDYAKAKTYLIEAINNLPGNAGLHSNLGNIYSAMGDMANAIQSYESAININPRLQMRITTLE